MIKYVVVFFYNVLQYVGLGILLYAFLFGSKLCSPGNFIVLKKGKNPFFSAPAAFKNIFFLVSILQKET